MNKPLGHGVSESDLKRKFPSSSKLSPLYSAQALKPAKSQPSLVPQNNSAFRSPLISGSQDKLHDILRTKRQEEQIKMKNAEKRREEIAKQRAEIAKKKMEDWTTKLEKMKQQEEEKRSQVKLKNVQATPKKYVSAVMPRTPRKVLQKPRPLDNLMEEKEKQNSTQEKQTNAKANLMQQGSRPTFVLPHKKSRPPSPEDPVVGQKPHVGFGHMHTKISKVHEIMRQAAKPAPTTSEKSNAHAKPDYKAHLPSTTPTANTDTDDGDDSFYSAVGGQSDDSLSESDSDCDREHSSPDSGVKVSEGLSQNWKIDEKVLQAQVFSMILIPEYQNMNLLLFPPVDKTYRLCSRKLQG